MHASGRIRIISNSASALERAVDTAWGANIIGFVRACLGTVKNIIRAHKQQTRARLLRRLRYIRRAPAVDRESHVGVGLAAVHIGVGRCQHDPVGPAALDQSRDLPRITNVGILRAEGLHLIFRLIFFRIFFRISGPCPRQRLAQQTRSAKNGDLHALRIPVALKFRWRTALANERPSRPDRAETPHHCIKKGGNLLPCDSPEEGGSNQAWSRIAEAKVMTTLVPTKRTDGT